MGIETIFFSYSRVDSEFALRLAKDLRKAGVALWIDQLDIKPGSRWDTSIGNALDKANCILTILSPNSVISDNVLDEVSVALDDGKKVIPILLKECKIPYRLGRLQRIDFSVNYEEGFNYLLNEMNNSIENPNNQTNDNEEFEFKERKQYNDEIDELLEKGKQHIEKLKATQREPGTQIIQKASNTNSLKESGLDVTQKHEGVLSKISTKRIRNIFYSGLFLFVVSFFLPMGNVYESHFGYAAALYALKVDRVKTLQDILFYIFINFSNLAMLFMAVFFFLKSRTWYLGFVLLGIVSGLWWFVDIFAGTELFTSTAYMVWIISQLTTAFAFYVKTRKKDISLK